MPDIRVARSGGDSYEVRVSDGAGSTRHLVIATEDDVERYGGGVAAERLVAASFEFLLEREPKESILGTFELPVIEQYFPEYVDRIVDYLGD
jgi:hypothetical protein